jgi:hypothetical protein
MQTRYSFSTGFASKNQSTILSQNAQLKAFGLAHLNQQTNISSPLISVYDSYAHAEAVAKRWAEIKGRCLLVEVDTKHLARGPVLRASDLLKEEGKGRESEVDSVHKGELLVMYRIPAQAIRMETPFGNQGEAWMAPGRS